MNTQLYIKQLPVMLWGTIFGFLSLALVPPSVNAQEWVSSRVFGPFACWGTFDLSSVENDLQHLAQVAQELDAKIGLPASEEWVELYVFRNETEWRVFHQKEYPTIPYRRALFLKKKKGRGQLFLHLSKNFVDDLRHEGTHALLHAVLPTVPIWLDEGLAEYFETPTSPRISRSEWFKISLKRAQNRTTEKIILLETLSEMDEMTPEHYADSWVWVTFLLDGPEEVRDILPTHISEMLKHKSLAVFPTIPISRRLGKVYTEPEGELYPFLKKYAY
ncbi:MAG: hypothetical protein Q4C70_10770 [Planctomycetia bacterium]|nr:hypothetical protein [Planctomycetia bacterium]